MVLKKSNERFISKKNSSLLEMEMGDTIYSKKYREEHKEEIRENNKNYNLEHREEHKVYQKDYYQKHKEKKLKYLQNYRVIHKNKIKEYSKNWREINKERISKKRVEKTQKLRLEVMKKLTDGNIRCQNPNCSTFGGCKDIRCLQIDHIDGGGTKERKTVRSYSFYSKLLKLPSKELKSKYKLLCANCNCIKRIENKERNLRSYEVVQ